jgi:hypothetical protein
VRDKCNPDPPRPAPEPASRSFSPGRVLRDAALAGFALAGVASPQNPIVSTLAFGAFCYFGLSLVFLTGPPLLRLVLIRDPDAPRDDGEERDPDILRQEDDTDGWNRK